MREWDDLARDLESVADDLDGIAQDAGELVGDLPVHREYGSPIGRFDPRFSQVKGAQFVASIVSYARTIRRLGESIEENGE